MKPIDFEESTIKIAEHQDEYITLPAHVDETGVVTSCWEFTFKERLSILFGSPLFLSQMTFGKSLQPQLPMVDNPIKSTIACHSSEN